MADTDNYEFSSDSEVKFKDLEAKFPERSSLVLWALHLVQDDVGFVPHSAVDYVAKRVGVSSSWVAGVVSFYSMYYDHPVGKYNLNICYNAACWMHGSDDLEGCVTEKLGIGPGETTKDGKFTFTRQAECLAACGNAPAIQVNHDYHENMTADKMASLIDELSKK